MNRNLLIFGIIAFIFFILSFHALISYPDPTSSTLDKSSSSLDSKKVDGGVFGHSEAEQMGSSRQGLPHHSRSSSASRDPSLSAIQQTVTKLKSGTKGPTYIYEKRNGQNDPQKRQVSTFSTLFEKNDHSTDDHLDHQASSLRIKSTTPMSTFNTPPVINTGGAASLSNRGVGGDTGLNDARSRRLFWTTPGPTSGSRFEEDGVEYDPSRNPRLPGSTRSAGNRADPSDNYIFTPDHGNFERANLYSNWELVYLDRLRIHRAPMHTPFHPTEYLFRSGITSFDVLDDLDGIDLSPVVKSYHDSMMAEIDEEEEGSETRNSNNNNSSSTSPRNSSQPSTPTGNSSSTNNSSRRMNTGTPSAPANGNGRSGPQNGPQNGPQSKPSANNGPQNGLNRPNSVPNTPNAPASNMNNPNNNPNNRPSNNYANNWANNNNNYANNNIASNYVNNNANNWASNNNANNWANTNISTNWANNNPNRVNNNVNNWVNPNNNFNMWNSPPTDRNRAAVARTGGNFNSRDVDFNYNYFGAESTFYPPDAFLPGLPTRPGTVPPRSGVYGPYYIYGAGDEGEIHVDDGEFDEKHLQGGEGEFDEKWFQNDENGENEFDEKWSQNSEGFEDKSENYEGTTDDENHYGGCSGWQGGPFSTFGHSDSSNQPDFHHSDFTHLINECDDDLCQDSDSDINLGYGCGYYGDLTDVVGRGAFLGEDASFDPNRHENEDENEGENEIDLKALQNIESALNPYSLQTKLVIMALVKEHLGCWDDDSEEGLDVLDNDDQYGHDVEGNVNANVKASGEEFTKLPSRIRKQDFSKFPKPQNGTIIPFSMHEIISSCENFYYNELEHCNYPGQDQDHALRSEKFEKLDLSVGEFRCPNQPKMIHKIQTIQTILDYFISTPDSPILKSKYCPPKKGKYHPLHADNKKWTKILKEMLIEQSLDQRAEQRLKKKPKIDTTEALSRINSNKIKKKPIGKLSKICPNLVENFRKVDKVSLSSSQHVHLIGSGLGPVVDFCLDLVGTINQVIFALG